MDIRRPGGNLLIAYGFTRTRPEERSETRSNRYDCALDEGASVALWGFGLLFRLRRRGAVFLSRHDAAPRVSLDPAAGGAAFASAELTACRPPRTAREVRLARAGLAGALAWIADYERWVVAHAGRRHRVRALAEWKHRVGRADQDTDAAWRLLAADVARELRTPRPDGRRRRRCAAAAQPLDHADAASAGPQQPFIR